MEEREITRRKQIKCIHCGANAYYNQGKQELLKGLWMCNYCLEEGKPYYG